MMTHQYLVDLFPRRNHFLSKIFIKNKQQMTEKTNYFNLSDTNFFSKNVLSFMVISDC